MTATQLVLGIPATILSLVQDGLIARQFHDALYPALMFRSEAVFEDWPENAGTTIIETRAGLKAPTTAPLAAGTDPVPTTGVYEQWVARLNRYAWTNDTHMPTSAVAAQNLMLRDIHTLGLQAGQSVNRLARNELFKAYLSGHTALTAATAAVDLSIQVASLNGFTDVVIKGSNVAPVPVSASAPLPITINGTISRNVVQAIPNDPNDPFGPGILVLSAAVGSIVAARSSVLSSFRPKIIRASGGTSVDALVSNSTLKLQHIIDAVSTLRKNNVRPHEDGLYHVHMPNDGNSQIFADDVFQRLNTALPDAAYYQEAFVGKIGGSGFYLNNECPDSTNSGATTSTGANASLYSADIGAETVNDGGVKVARTIVTGRGAMYEKGFDEDAYLTEAGTTGKVGDFQVVNAGISIVTDRIRLILRAPLNRLQDQIAETASISTSFPVPSDISSGGTERFKRAVVIEHASTI